MFDRVKVKDRVNSTLDMESQPFASGYVNENIQCEKKNNNILQILPKVARNYFAHVSHHN